MKPCFPTCPRHDCVDFFSCEEHWGISDDNKRLREMPPVPEFTKRMRVERDKREVLG